MNLLSINIIQSCNKNPYCEYCPQKRWLYPVDYYFPPLPDEDEETALKNRKYVNRINNEVLLNWLDKYVNPETTLIELSGGEPGLYHGITELIPALTERGYKGIIKTNGSLPIPKSGNFTRVTSWHCGTKEPPEYYDTYLILRDETDGHIEKIWHCQNNKIPYFVQWLDHLREKKGLKYLDGIKTHFLKWTVMNSSGTVAGCWRQTADSLECESIFYDHKPILKDLKDCRTCAWLVLIEQLFPENIKRQIKDDFEKEQRKIEINNLKAVC